MDSLLLPVVKAYEQRQTQLRLDSFITMTHRFSKIRSKRLQAAVSAVAGGPLSDELTLTAEERAASEQVAKAGTGPRGKQGSGTKRKQRSEQAAQGSAEEEGMGGAPPAGAAAPRRSKRAKAAPPAADSTAGGGTAQGEVGQLSDGDSHDSILDAEDVDTSMRGFFY